MNFSIIEYYHEKHLAVKDVSVKINYRWSALKSVRINTPITLNFCKEFENS